MGLFQRCDGDTRDVPLSLRFETKRHWPALQSEFGCGKSGACIILALAAEARGAGRMVSYSRRAEHYSRPQRYRNPLYTRRSIIPAVDSLDADRLIEHDRAWAGRWGNQSAMKATPELLSRVDTALKGMPPPRIMIPTEGIILRDMDKELIDYTDTSSTLKMRRGLDRINRAIQGTDIGGAAASPLVRVFNRTFGRGGRFYAMGGGWQSMKSEARKQITIGGEPVVEIDFKRLHPSMLYAMAGATLPADCYAIGNWPEKLVKAALMVMVNAADERQAIGAIAHWEKLEKVAGITPGSPHAFGLAQRIMNDIRKAHSPIGHFFYSDKGAELMQLDSSIAEAVMHTMLGMGVVVLPVHDSFLVQESKAEWLERAMMKAAYEIGFEALTVEYK